MSNYTGRNCIVYYSAWLSRPGVGLLDITDEDKNGFMTAIHRLDRTKGLDLILHTPGGNIAATQSLVDYLHKMFGSDMRAIVPQIAMSAGTMVACSCKSIVMGKQSNLGPIDPQMRGIPAAGVIKEFRQAYEEIKKDNTKALIWREIIGKYNPTFLSQCQNAINWSNAFVRDQLSSVMFAGQPDAREKARGIVRRLSDYARNKDHSRHIHAGECKTMGLVIEDLEADETLQDLVLSVHHACMVTMSNTLAYKIIENQLGRAFLKTMPVSA